MKRRPGRRSRLPDVVGGHAKQVGTHQADPIGARISNGVVRDDGRLPAQAVGDDAVFAGRIDLVANQG